MKILDPGPRRGLPSFVTVLAMAALTGAPACPAQTTGTAVELSLQTSGGHDNDVLGRPGESASSYPRLSQGYLLLTPGVSAMLERGRWRLDGNYSLAHNAYESSQAGTYTDYRGWARAEWSGSRRVTASLEGETEWYRRSAFPDFDVNRLELVPRLSWGFAPDWTLAGAVRIGRDQYPARNVGSDSLQTDTPVHTQFELAWQPDETWGVTALGMTLHNGSNQRLYRYSGYRTGLSLDAAPWRGFTGRLEMAYESRDYNQFAVRVFILPLRILYQPRHDFSYSVDLGVKKRLSPWLSLAASASRLDYHSNAPGYAFGDTRVEGGFELTWGFGRSHDTGGTGLSFLRALAAGDPAGRGDTASVFSLAPVVKNGSVEFRCRAPGARTVALVGTFNGWNRAASVMTGPDGDGIWKIRIPMGPGTHRYMFVVDGQWRKPEGAAFYEDDGFGMENGVLDIH